MKIFILIIYALLSFILINPSAVFAVVEVWPGVEGHGTSGWQLADAPGSGSAKLYIINSLTDGAASGSEDTDYNGTGQSAFVGNPRYALESAANEDGGNDPNGKLILLAINGTYNEESDWFIFLEDQDWTVVDFNPPGITTGVLWRNVKFAAFSSDDTLTHFFIKDFRCYHGGGANGVDGGSIATAYNQVNRKCMAFNIEDTGESISYIGVHQSTLAWSADGPISINGDTLYGDVSNVTISKSLIANPIAYGKMEDWSGSTTYSKYAIVQHATYDGYYESLQSSNYNHEPTGVGDSWWRLIEKDNTNRAVDSWIGLTTNQIDYVSIVGNIFANISQRAPLVGNFGVFNVDNNIVFNSKSLGSNVNSNTAVGYNDWMKGTLIGNIAIGGPNSTSLTDEEYPNLWVKSNPALGWYATTIESGTADSGTSSTLTDSSESWGDLSAYAIRLISDTGADQAYRQIASNTGTVITISGTWEGSNPNGTTGYEVIDLSNHDLYIADNQMIECETTPCISNYTVRQQDDLDNIFDWDLVDNREDIPESQVKHTSEPTGSHVSEYSPMDDGIVESTLLAKDGSGAGAYNSNQDTETEAIFDEVINRTSGYITSIDEDNADFPTITSSGPITLNIPTDMWGLCDDGYYRIEYWLHNSGSMAGCITGDPPKSPSGSYNANAPGGGYNVNAPGGSYY